MPYTSDIGTGGIGARIRELRAVRGFTLAELGRRAHVSTSMLSMIEKGDRNASGQIVGSLAAALGVGVSHLYGQPYIEQMRQDQIDRMMEPLGSALDNWDIPPAHDDPPPRPLEDLRTDVMATRAMRERADLAGLADWLFSIRSRDRSDSNEVLDRVSWTVRGHDGRASW